jgi:hypothetical protein
MHMLLCSCNGALHTRNADTVCTSVLRERLAISHDNTQVLARHDMQVQAVITPKHGIIVCVQWF